MNDHASVLTRTTKHTPVRTMIAQLFRSVEHERRRLIRHSFAEETICFEPDSLAEGVTLYIIDDGSPNRLWLNGIESSLLRQGHADRVLRLLCTIADELSITLAGNALAYDPNGSIPAPNGTYPDTNALLRWYARYGFRPTRTPEEGNAIAIERQPQPPIDGDRTKRGNLP